MVTTDRGQTLCQTIAHNHVDADAVYELLDVGTDGSTCRGEEVGILQSQLLTHQREDGTVEYLVLQVQCHGRLLA